MAGRKKAGGDSPDMAAVVAADMATEQVKQDNPVEIPRKTPKQLRAAAAKEFRRLQLLYYKPAVDIAGGLSGGAEKRSDIAGGLSGGVGKRNDNADGQGGGDNTGGRSGGAEKRRGLKGMRLAIDENKYNALLGLMKQTAFMSAQLDDLAEQLYYIGVTETYKNGAEQYGTKESTQSKAYNTIIKNYITAIKTLADCTPEAEVKDALMDFLAARTRK